MKTTVFGVPGQDSYYLIKLLIERGDEVIGVHRRAYNHDFSDFNQFPHLKLEMCDLTDASGVSQLIKKHQPDQCYNLAAQSFVGISFSNPTHTLFNNIIGQTNLLEAIRHESPKTKLFYAGSSEEFGNAYDEDENGKYQGDCTKLSPVSPYGVSKVACRHMNRIYRDAYGLFICTAQSHNHSSFRRPSQFLFGKIVRYVAELKVLLDSGNFDAEKFPKLQLGNVESTRDESSSEDVMRAAVLMMDQEKADDYVVCSGIGTKVKDILRMSFEHIGIVDYSKYWEVNPKFFRELELDFLTGRADKILRIGWKPSQSVKDLVGESIHYHIRKLQCCTPV